MFEITLQQAGLLNFQGHPVSCSSKHKTTSRICAFSRVLLVQDLDGIINSTIKTLSAATINYSISAIMLGLKKMWISCLYEKSISHGYMYCCYVGICSFWWKCQHRDQRESQPATWEGSLPLSPMLNGKCFLFGWAQWLENRMGLSVLLLIISLCCMELRFFFFNYCFR